MVLLFHPSSTTSEIIITREVIGLKIFNWKTYF
jgi:hypothetical protein